MTMNQKRLFGPRQAVTSDTDTTSGRYLVPDNTVTIVKQIIACNTSASPVTVNAAVGVTATAGNRIMSAIALAANETISFNCSVVMTAGEKLYLTASSTAVSFTVSGVEET